MVMVIIQRNHAVLRLVIGMANASIAAVVVLCTPGALASLIVGSALLLLTVGYTLGSVAELWTRAAVLDALPSTAEGDTP